MTAIQVLDELKTKIQFGIEINSALKLFVEHYDATEVESTSKDEEGDMLLFEWGGPYSWNETFSISLTRQFSYTDEAGNYLGMEQLSMDCRYSPDEVKIESGNFWFEENNVDEFLNRIFNSNAFVGVKDLKMNAIDFKLNNV